MYIKHYTQDNVKDSTNEFLVDKTKNGKERPWRDKKARSLVMSDVHYGAGIDKKAKRMAECGETLVFKKLADGSMKLEKAYFCKCRLCPMCIWRKSLKLVSQNHAIIRKANEENNLKWIFLTLTTKNPLPHELKNEIKNMMSGWNRLMGYKRVENAIVGWFRALEVTKNIDVNSKDFGTYNPHFHVLIAVRPSYFKKKEYYITHEEWTSLWQKAMKLDYKPVVNIQRVKARKTTESIYDVTDKVKRSIQENGAILEVSKYPVKDSDIVDVSQGVTSEAIETVQILDEALQGRRLMAYGGLLKKIHKELNLDDVEEGDLVHVEEGQDEVADEVGKVVATWSIGFQNYVIKSLE